jgi:hypothetical protein
MLATTALTKTSWFAAPRLVTARAIVEAPWW